MPICPWAFLHFSSSVIYVFLLWLSIPDTIYYQCLLFFIQASDCLILLLHPYILLDILNLLDLQLVRHFDIALFWLSNRLILVVLCILLGAKPGWEQCHIRDVQAGALAGAYCSTSLFSRWLNPSMNARRLQSFILFYHLFASVAKNEHFINGWESSSLVLWGHLCPELIWNCIPTMNLISHCHVIFQCSYMRPCFTCMDAFRQPVCCLCIPPTGWGISLCFLSFA